MYICTLQAKTRFANADPPGLRSTFPLTYCSLCLFQTTVWIPPNWKIGKVIWTIGVRWYAFSGLNKSAFFVIAAQNVTRHRLRPEDSQLQNRRFRDFGSSSTINGRRFAKLFEFPIKPQWFKSSLDVFLCCGVMPPKCINGQNAGISHKINIEKIKQIIANSTSIHESNSGSKVSIARLRTWRAQASYNDRIKAVSNLHTAYSNGVQRAMR
ncbi:MAG: hypothetical protein MI861_04790 [Pirellulales bacterium]|nr:hypothetical protein [Pirellulales bacterium]